jgi:hypothetical protein
LIAGTKGLVREEPKLAGYTLEWADPSLCIFSKRNRLYSAAAPDAPRTHLATFPAPPWKAAASTVRIAQRLLRFMFTNVLQLRDGTWFVTFDKSIGILSGSSIRVLRGLHVPSRVVRGCCALSRDGDVYFGEYWGNPDRGPMRVYRYSPGSDVIETAHTFGASEVRHVHGVFADPWSGDLWCTTGDKGGECRIMKTSDGFRTIDVVGTGDETWRAVTPQFTRDAIYYAMDAEYQQNYIFRIDRTSGVRETIGPVEGPVYYATTAAGNLYFGVTAELCPSQQGKFAAIWRVRADGHAERIFTMDKDWLHPWYLMYGLIEFPRGPGLANRLYFHTTALKADDAMFSVDLTA